MRTCAILTALFVTPVLGAADQQPLTPIDTKAKSIEVVVPKDGDARKPIEITSAEELAKSRLFAEGAAEKVKKEVNFEKEKLVVFAWSGSGRDSVTGVLTTTEKLVFEKTVFDQAVFAEFKYTPGLTFDLRRHFQMFVVPKDAFTRVSVAPPVCDETADVKEISLKDLKIAFPENPGGPTKPEIIASAAQLADSPALKGAADEIKKQVDFDTQKLVFVAWLGSSTDRFTMEAKRVETKLILAFQVFPGAYVDLYKHTRLFVVPKKIGVETAGGD